MRIIFLSLIIFQKSKPSRLAGSTNSLASIIFAPNLYVDHQSLTQTPGALQVPGTVGDYGWSVSPEDRSNVPARSRSSRLLISIQ